VRVAVTGIASDFGTAIAPLLFADDEIEEVVGIDLREPRVVDPKLRFEREDVRSARMRKLFEGCEAVVHLAYVVAEIHDKELTHSINIGGSRNVLAAAADAGVRRLVMASSVASYGAHADFPLPITEDEFPRGNPDKYYFYDKAEVEHFLEWWLARNPDSGMTVTRLRPAIILGPHFDNPVVRQLAMPFVALPGDSFAKVQLVWEDDLARAFWQAVKQDAPGPFNVATDDWMDIKEVGELHGQRQVRIPSRVAVPLVDALFRLHASPVSAHWVASGEVVVSIARARRELGWSPRFSSRDAALLHLIQRGRPIQPGRSRDAFARKELAEEALEPPTIRLSDWARSIPGLRGALEGPGEVEGMAARVEHVLFAYRGTQIHCEVHQAEDAANAPTIVFSPGIGGYSRFYLPLLGKLCDDGFNVVGVDRPGHGLSEGRRGDCTVDQALDVIESAVALARRRFGGPVCLLGSSLGGILSWYALTREPDVEAVVCHNVAHPSVFHEPAARLKAPAVRRLAAVAPFTGIPIKLVADFSALAQSPELLEWAQREDDRIWAWRVSARSVASLYEYEPPLDWSRVQTPALVLVGEEDRMVSAEFTRRVLDISRPSRADLRILPRLGHMLFHDHLDECLPLVTSWLRTTLASTRTDPEQAAV
jgi:UDP-glucose 4-epimerase